ncbi:MAG: hypothetical protein M1834_006087 [Cirrosporium novae-zelandiae]|nr:MAG: hypothetical protein M1834_006087 [Cirrosporium novae-zelandiae]
MSDTVSPKSTFFPERPPLPTESQMKAGIDACLTVQRRALTQGKRPFAGVLVGPDNTTVLLTHQSVDHVNHAEASLARLASSHFTQPYLWQCTLYSTWEPCAMCSATIYWANIGRVVFAASNDQLEELTGPGNDENFTMKWHTKEILSDEKTPQKDIQIIGPVEGLDRIVMEEADVYWSKTRAARGIKRS